MCKPFGGISLVVLQAQRAKHIQSKNLAIAIWQPCSRAQLKRIGVSNHLAVCLVRRRPCGLIASGEGTALPTFPPPPKCGALPELVKKEGRRPLRK